MTDGPTLPLEHNILFGGAIFDMEEQGAETAQPERLIISDSPANSIRREVLDSPALYAFSTWLELQPVGMDVDLLYAIAADLTRRGWGGVAYEVRRQADDLKVLTRLWAMAEDDAEAILMAVEVGLFHGRPSEVAHALLVIANREEEEL